MTYRELKNWLDNRSKEQLDMDVTIYDTSEGEYFPLMRMGVTAVADDILDKNHPYLVL